MDSEWLVMLWALPLTGLRVLRVDRERKKVVWMSSQVSAGKTVMLEGVVPMGVDGGGGRGEVGGERRRGPEGRWRGGR